MPTTVYITRFDPFSVCYNKNASHTAWLCIMEDKSAPVTAEEASEPTIPPAGLSFLDYFIAQARAKYFCHPQYTDRALANGKLTSAFVLSTPEQMEASERLDHAIHESGSLLEEARAQLAAPISSFLPANLTVAERSEAADAELWNAGYALTDQCTDEILEKNDALFEDVMALINESDSLGLLTFDDVQVPCELTRPDVSGLEVAREVKDWIQESRKPWLEYDRRAPFSGKSQDSGHSLSREPDVVAAKSTASRGIETSVVDRVHFFDGLQADLASHVGKAERVGKELKSKLFRTCNASRPGTSMSSPKRSNMSSNSWVRIAGVDECLEASTVQGKAALKLSW